MAHDLLRSTPALVATTLLGLGCQLASGLSEYDVVPGDDTPSPTSTTTQTSTSAATSTSGGGAGGDGSGGDGGGPGGGGGAGGAGPACGNGLLDDGEECDDATTDDPSACRDCVVVCDQGVKDPLTLGCYVPRSRAEKMSQEEGQELCRTLGPTFDLVGIGSPEESAFLLESSLLLQTAWTGGVDPELDGTFVDAQGEPIDCPWAPNNPDGGVGCMFLAADGCHDAPCTGQATAIQLAICERLPPGP